MPFQSRERRMADSLRCTFRRIVAVMVAIISSALLANTITVNDPGSGSVVGKCTLQDAFVAANTNAVVNGCSAGGAGVDTIVFAPGITNIVLAQRFPPGFGSYALEAKEDLIVDGGAVAGSGVPVVTISRDTGPATPVFGMIFASGKGGGAGPSYNFTLKGIKVTGAVIAGALVGDNVTISDSVIDGNVGSSSNGGINADRLTITDSTVSNNSRGQGGGISANTLTLSNTTVSGNSGDPGGIFAGNATLTNATISGNTSAFAGGTAGMSLDSGTLKFVTITANAITGANGSVSVGLLTRNTSTVSLSHVVIGGNLGSAGSSDVGATYGQPNSIVGDHSWIGSLDINAQAALASGVLIASCASTNFGPLANNGGGKATHALLAGSCLIDAGAPCASTPLSSDERGAGFNRCVNTKLDIGAFESQVVTSLPSTTALLSSINPANVGQAVTFTATVTGSGGTPTGTVTFKDGAATLGTGALNAAGNATFATSSLALGTHPVTAVYGGDATYTGSTSSIVSEVISPLSMTANAGTTPQSAAVSTAFANPLAVTVKDSGSNPVSGVNVTFIAPSVGASGVFSNSTTTIVVATNAAGVAAAPFTANGTVGGPYSVSATAAGVATPVTFSMQNTAPANVATLTVIGGNGQSTRVSTAFPIALTVKAADGGGMPVPNAVVQFGVPAQAATAVPSANSAITDVNGRASITATASAISGVYQVTATSGAGSTSFNLANTITIAAGNTCGGNAFTNADLVEQYYAAVLRRASDAGGKAYWISEADRLCALGADPKETFFLLANVFFNSPEYLAFNRDNAGFVTDTYVTFFGRQPDAGGLAYWTGQIASGMPRTIVMSSFLFSPEFTATMNGVFPGRTARAETYLTLNLYGGLFRRLADSAGYTNWDNQFRAAQCNASPATAVRTTIDTVSSQFLAGAEYAARHATNSQFVQDLYYALLQRGGDLAGFNFWVGQLTGGVQTREQVRQQFIAGPEMQAQSTAIAAQGCLP
jgi:hypothetical protein